MSRIKLKQLNEDPALVGGTIVYDGTKLVFSNDSTNSLQLPAGTNAQRPGSPSDGLIRYNNETGEFEGFLNSAWENLVRGTDKRLSNANTLIVTKDPGPGEFSSVKAAMDSITGNNASNPFQIVIYPGRYIEDTITWKEYVFVSGIGGSQSVTIIANVASNRLIDIQNIDIGGMSELSIRGVTDNTTEAVFIQGVAQSFLLQDVQSQANANFLLVQGSTGSTTVNFENISAVSDSILENYITVDGSFALTQMTGTGLLAQGAVATSLGDLVIVTGPNAEFSVDSFLVDAGSNVGNAFTVRDGSSSLISSGAVEGYRRGLYAENAGTGPNIRTLGIELRQSSLYDADIDHPDTTGFLNITADETLVTINPSAPLQVAIADPNDGAFSISGTINLKPTNTNLDALVPVNDLILQGGTMGLYQGGTINPTGGTGISVAAGQGYVEKPGSPHTYEFFTWNTTPLTLPSDANQYIIVTNTGVVTDVTSLPDNEETIILGRVTTHSGNIDYISATPLNARHYSNKTDNLLRRAIGSIYESGSLVAENGGTPFALDVGSGSWYFGNNNFTPSGGTNINWTAHYHSGGSFIQTSESVVNNTHYDDGTDLVPLSSGFYTKHTLYTVGEGALEEYLLVYGQEEFSSLAAVEEAAIANPPPDFDKDLPAIAAIVVQEGAANITNILDIRPVIGFQAAGSVGTSDHGSLQGLLDDDHPQYFRTDGTRTMTGSINVGGFDITNVGTVDGIDVTNHSARHQPNGADPLSTAAATTLTPTTTNTEGISNSFARADHKHEVTGFVNAVQDSGANVNTTAETLNFIGNLSAVDAGGNVVTVSTTGEPDQNIWETVQADTGSTTAGTTTDTLTVAGGTGINTAITGDTLTVSLASTFQRAVVTSATYNAAANDTYIGINSGTETTVFLQSSPTEGQKVIVKDEAGQAKNNTITIDGNGTTIDEKSTVAIGTNYGALQLLYAGTEWHIV